MVKATLLSLARQDHQEVLASQMCAYRITPTPEREMGKRENEERKRKRRIQPQLSPIAKTDI